MNIQDFTQRNESQIDSILGASITDSEEKVSPRDLANWINSKTQRISVPSTATSNILVPTTATFLAIPSFSSDFAAVDTINNVLTMTKNGFLKGKLRLNVLSTSSFIDIQLTDGAGVVHPNSRRRIESEDSSIEFSFENFVSIGDSIKIKIKASGVANLQYLSPDSDFGAQSPYIFVFEFIEKLPVSVPNIVNEMNSQAFSKNPKSQNQLARGEMTVYDLSSIEGEDITNEDIFEVGTLAGEERKITYFDLLNRIKSDSPLIPPSGVTDDFPQSQISFEVFGSGSLDLSIPENRNASIYIKADVDEQITYNLIRGNLAYKEPFYLRFYSRTSVKSNSFIIIKSGYDLFQTQVFANEEVVSSVLIEGWYYFVEITEFGFDALMKIN